MGFILLDDFNGNLNIICKDDGSIFANLQDAETLLDEYCQDGIIVPLGNTIGLIKRVKEMFDSGKIYIEQEALGDSKIFMALKNDINEILE